MRGTGIMLILVGLMLGVFGVLIDTSKVTFFLGAVLLLAVGIATVIIATKVRSRQNELLAQFQQMQGTGAIEGTSVDPVTGMPGSFDMSSMDPKALMKIVMDAQNESGGDPEKMAEILRQRFPSS